MRYLINLSYDGSHFYGYQVQNNAITVQGEVEKCLSKIFNEKIKIISSSRTDRKVHAYDQYCHFDSNKKINTSKLMHSLNSLINKSIYIKNIKLVDDEFHARYNVLKKEYVYKINLGKYNPIEKDYVLQYNKKLNTGVLNEFISVVSGKHNFKSFTSDKDSKTYERDIIIDYKISKEILYLRFESSGFLRYMIRNIVGLLIDINDGKKSISDINKIFNEKSRTASGKCASPEGLYLNKIYFNN
ncbi:MAG: tRNA pseudouridine(38-40) synthase TruA [Tenericutes bacterium]|nr:tRNA pseudouridine(38-40) synthase TruA [Mycoplasmatota bacterium]